MPYDVLPQKPDRKSSPAAPKGCSTGKRSHRFGAPIMPLLKLPSLETHCWRARRITQYSSTLRYSEVYTESSQHGRAFPTLKRSLHLWSSVLVKHLSSIHHTSNTGLPYCSGSSPSVVSKRQLWFCHTYINVIWGKRIESPREKTNNNVHRLTRKLPQCTRVPFYPLSGLCGQRREPHRP